MLVYENIEHWAKKSPHKICIEFCDTKLTYGELSDKTEEYSKRLASIIKKGEKIIIKHPHPVMQLIYLLAASKAGVISVMVDSYVPDNFLKHLVSKFQPILVIDEKFILPTKGVSHISDVFSENLFLGVLSSGSTGIPKVFWRNHQSWVSAFSTQSKVFSMGRLDRLLLTGSLAYSANLNSCLHLLHEGGTVVFANNKKPKTWHKQIVEQRITSIFMVPAHYRILLAVLADSHPHISSLVSAGAKLDIQLLHRLIVSFPNAHICEYYGAGELGHVSFATAADLQRYPDSVGKPFPGVKVWIENKSVWVKSPYLAPDFQPQATIGDMGRMNSEGYLFLSGREDNVINCGGIKVIPEQIEHILNHCPDISSCVVRGIDDYMKGQRIAAWIVRSNLSLTEKSIRHYCLKHLPPKYCPQKFFFITEFPLNTNGKIDIDGLLKQE